MTDSQDFDSKERTQVNLGDPEDVRYWTERFGVSEDDLRAAVEGAGPSGEAVAKRLEKTWLP
ncbi:DUF3606 domain-containing protein [Variovorax sp. OV329]|uniref:DUF3606 domain-containing protein n=1 Tax=Variovorax sp. OV329 TaxID=1882825 RepID=UPI0008F439E5|nr:DUF3606 domain-containing protein [Variovorax sp. OV329]SFM88999.1 Protein of unknown function [Variovorax sp. OV329]